MQQHLDVPESLPSSAWQELDRLVHEGDYWEMLLPSTFSESTPMLETLANQFDLRRKDDPLSVLHRLNKQLYEHFDYKPRSTKADSPIDLALKNCAGVCQDFAHIMLGLLRTRLQIPARYVSGYLYHGEGAHDRSESSATHAWIEAFLPELGWVGFDPTNDLVAAERHIRTAIGRDYADVPPTHGLFRGRTKSELTVAVRVEPNEGTVMLDRDLPVPEEWSVLVERAQAIPEQPAPPRRSHQQAQQQQDVN
jgi:transglutaminase-like putative cysteine protease